MCLIGFMVAWAACGRSAGEGFWGGGGVGVIEAEELCPGQVGLSQVGLSLSLLERLLKLGGGA